MAPHFPLTRIPSSLASFSPTSVTEISTLRTECTNSYCDLDPIPTSLLKLISSSISPTICNIVNFSHFTGTVPSSLKYSVVTPLLKKPLLDKEDLTKYRPISNLSTISKITDRVLKTRFLNHLSSNSLLNAYQSAYYKTTPLKLPICPCMTISPMRLHITKFPVYEFLTYMLPSTPLTTPYYSLDFLFDLVSHSSPSAGFALIFVPLIFCVYKRNS